MKTNPRRGAQFSLDAIALEENLMIAWMHHFILVGKPRRGSRQAIDGKDFSRLGHHWHAIDLPAMDVTEALNLLVPINITIHPIIANLGVGTQIHHAERTTSRGKKEPPRFMGVHERINVISRGSLRAAQRGRGKQKCQNPIGNIV